MHPIWLYSDSINKKLKAIAPGRVRDRFPPEGSSIQTRLGGKSMIAQIEDVRTQQCNSSGGCHNKRNKEKLQEIAKQLLEQAGLGGRFYPEERDFVSTSSRLILPVIENFLASTGGQPPALATVRDWFYKGCSDLMIAVLASQIKQK
ncbi:MAG: hypothetical protein ACYTXF_35405 [Nostoc sp.]